MCAWPWGGQREKITTTELPAVARRAAPVCARAREDGVLSAGGA